MGPQGFMDPGFMDSSPSLPVLMMSQSPGRGVLEEAHLAEAFLSF
jgi:hypothetical protein